MISHSNNQQGLASGILADAIGNQVREKCISPEHFGGTPAFRSVIFLQYSQWTLPAPGAVTGVLVCSSSGPRDHSENCCSAACIEKHYTKCPSRPQITGAKGQALQSANWHKTPLNVTCHSGLVPGVVTGQAAKAGCGLGNKELQVAGLLP